MGEFIFDIPVRRGLPSQVGGLTDVVRSPLYSAPVGLLKYGLTEINLDKEINNNDKKFPEMFVDWAKKLRDVIAQGL